MRSRRAFTFIELMVTVTIIAIISVMVMPLLGNDDRAKLMAATQLIMSDIENAQVLTIALPEDPIIVRLDPANNRYWLAPADDPETPILHESTGQPYLVTFGQGRALVADGVVFTVASCPNNKIEFDANGALVDFTAAPTITITCGDETVEVFVAPTTGTVFERD